MRGSCLEVSREAEQGGRAGRPSQGGGRAPTAGPSKGPVMAEGTAGREAKQRSWAEGLPAGGGATLHHAVGRRAGLLPEEGEGATAVSLSYSWVMVTTQWRM